MIEEREKRKRREKREKIEEKRDTREDREKIEEGVSTFLEERRCQLCKGCLTEPKIAQIENKEANVM
jgi:hypothetical protein